MAFKLGQRVRYTGSSLLGPVRGSVGTVALVATGKGKSIHPDPSRKMTFVQWDNNTAEGVFTCMLRPLRWDLYWSPSGLLITAVEADTAAEAVRKVPKPYSRFKGEVYAKLQDTRS